MPKGGHNAKPTDVHKANGTYRPSVHGDRLQAETIKDLPPAPPDFKEEAVEVWVALCSQLKELGILTSSDLYAVRMFVEAHIDEMEARRTLEKEGKYINEGTRLNPAWRVATEAAKMKKALFAEFGLTPLARTKIHIPEKKNEVSILDLMKGGKR